MENRPIAVQKPARHRISKHGCTLHEDRVQSDSVFKYFFMSQCSSCNLTARFMDGVLKTCSAFAHKALYVASATTNVKVEGWIRLWGISLLGCQKRNLSRREGFCNEDCTQLILVFVKNFVRKQGNNAAWWAIIECINCKTAHFHVSSLSHCLLLFYTKG